MPDLHYVDPKCDVYGAGSIVKRIQHVCGQVRLAPLADSCTQFDLRKRPCLAQIMQYFELVGIK